ncbi:hypothetical protein BgiBS90_012502 [Biomphalaria glabrata]|nr:hypothetical protein BgiBS90_012502 [Biomphalaria glabrata]
MRWKINKEVDSVTVFYTKHRKMGRTCGHIREEWGELVGTSEKNGANLWAHKRRMGRTYGHKAHGILTAVMLQMTSERMKVKTLKT